MANNSKVDKIRFLYEWNLFEKFKNDASVSLLF